MAFRTRRLSYRPWPVTVTLQECGEDGAMVEVAEAFIGHFRPFTEQEMLDARRELFGDESSEEGKKRIAEMTVAEHGRLEALFFSRLMCGWGQVFDEQGSALAYSEAALAALVTGPDGPAVRRAINTALMEIRFGMAPAKNVATSPAPGPKPAADEAAPTS